MCRALAERGVDPLIVTTDADGLDRLAVPIGERTTWQGVPTLFFRRDFSESFKYSRGLAGWVSERIAQFDIVHIHAVLSHACLSAASTSGRARVPYVLRPLGTLAPWSLGQKALKKRIMLALGGRRAILQAAAVHCTSDDEKRDVEQAFPESRGVVIPLGIDQQFLDRPITPWTERSHDPYVLVLSRVHPKKNLEALIRAFVQTSSRDGFQHWRLVIAGSGDPEYVSSLEQLVRDLGAERRINFVGWAEGDSKHELICRASVFAIASFHENFGVSVLEALASGVPAVISRRVELSGAVDAAGAGWIVDTSAESVATGLAVALGDADQRRAKGLAAREFARRFSWNNVAIELVDLYSRIGAPLKRTASVDPSRSAGHPGAAVTR